MSYTVVRDAQYDAFERTNTWNAIIRHCKIGKVTKKVRKDIHCGYRPGPDGVWRLARR